MTQIVRLVGRFMKADDEAANIVCRVATATAPPDHREVGAGGDVQTSIFPTTIILHEVEPESLAHLRMGSWTHILWSGEIDASLRERAIRHSTIEGTNVRVIV